jgi:hypothetical protein
VLEAKLVPIDQKIFTGCRKDTGESLLHARATGETVLGNKENLFTQFTFFWVGLRNNRLDLLLGDRLNLLVRHRLLQSRIYRLNLLRNFCRRRFRIRTVSGRFVFVVLVFEELESNL